MQLPHFIQGRILTSIMPRICFELCFEILTGGKKKPTLSLRDYDF